MRKILRFNSQSAFNIKFFKALCYAARLFLIKEKDIDDSIESSCSFFDIEDKVFFKGLLLTCFQNECFEVVEVPEYIRNNELKDYLSGLNDD